MFLDRTSAGGTRLGPHLEHTAGAAEHLGVESGISRAVHWKTWQEKTIGDKPQITYFLSLVKMLFIFKGL